MRYVRSRATSISKYAIPWSIDVPSLEGAGAGAVAGDWASTAGEAMASIRPKSAKKQTNTLDVITSIFLDSSLF